MHFVIAWRNIWRNPRRTVVLLLAVVVGVWTMVCLGALMRGMIDSMVDNSISVLTGHIQVHAKGYLDDPVVEHSIGDPAPVLAALEKTLPQGAHWAMRVRVGGVGSNARHSGGVTIVGIDPEQEPRVSFYGKAVQEGAPLAPGKKNGVIMGKALVEKYETRIGHKLVLMSQAVDKEIASRAFKIKGIFRAELQGTEKQYVFVNIKSAQKMLGLGQGISEIAISLPDRSMVPDVTEALRKELSADIYTVSTWKELLPVMKAYLDMMDFILYIWNVVVFIAMGFGIVNTTLMAVLERIREFGLLKALGMRPGWIIKGVLLESGMILLLGVLLGDVLGVATTAVLAQHGLDFSFMAAGSEFVGMPRIIYPLLLAKDVLAADAVVLVLGAVVSIYPALKAGRITPVEAFAHT